MLSDIEIAEQAKMVKIRDIARQIGIEEDELELYGAYKAKVTPACQKRLFANPNGKLILVTAISPTPAGEGKTTTTVGLGDALRKRGKKAVLALREPSLGPVFGLKGGAAGGGYAQVVPMADINLHFTGDIHAITAANNLLCAALDNHIYQGNALDIDPEQVVFKRAMDINDRALRHIQVGLGGKTGGVPRNDAFMITVASEIMAILCLAEGIADLKRRLGNILVAYTKTGAPVYCKDLHVEGALAALLKDAINPNLVQTLEGTPCFMHGGPFANIAHGCNSVTATKLALKTGDYCVTEAGFGSDLGGEKFLDIKCRLAGLKPDAVVLVATVRALKYHGGVAKEDLKTENTAALQAGLCNLAAHLDSLHAYGLPVVVALNQFGTDTDAELRIVTDYLKEKQIPCALSRVHKLGGEGGLALADAVINACEKGGSLSFAYQAEDSIPEKIEKIVRRVYGGTGADFSEDALASLEKIEKMGFSGLPVCIAKTQYSLSDDPKKLGRPTNFRIFIRDIRLSAGAGFIVALAGTIMTMPGLPKIPAAEGIDVTEDGRITGLF